MDSELAAHVIVAPVALDIAQEQGYTVDHPGAKKIVDEIKEGAPLAYGRDKDHATLKNALADAIKLLDSVAFVRDENDNTGAVLSKLRDALSLVRGGDALPAESS
jgi:hypothetical protein